MNFPSSPVVSALVQREVSTVTSNRKSLIAPPQLRSLARATLTSCRVTGSNPTLKIIERIADSLNMSVLELLGFEVDAARRALKKNGVDFDELSSAIGKNQADRRVARQSRSRKLPG